MSAVTASPTGPQTSYADRPRRLGRREILRVITGAARSCTQTRLRTSGVFFYLLVWVSFPVFNLLTVTLIYRDDPALRSYAIIGGAGMAMMFAMQFNASEILDNERQRGTLGNLFMAPCPRFAWLGGFQLVAITESLLTATLNVAVGKAVFGLPLDVNPATLALALVLFVAAMWGFSMIVGAIGVAIRDANQLSNLIFPIVQIVAGTLYPIALMPGWVRIPAHALPFGYGISAIASSVTSGASPADVAGELWPLAGFAVVLPLLGVLAFRAVERRTRRSGSLELV